MDLARPLSPEQVAAVRRALLDHQIVVFPGQSLTREQQFAFAARFGEVETHGADGRENKRQDRAHILSNVDENGNPVFRLSPASNYHWHTDKPYRAAPPSVTMLFAVELPPFGGDTAFANTALAYEALPETSKCRLAGLRVAFRPAFDPAVPETDHPLVRSHPETGRKALYLGNHATRILGLPEEESAAMLRDLVEHATQSRFVYTHRWRLGDLVMWDNRCLLHRAVPNYQADKYRRIMHRSVVKGTVPF